MDTSGGGGIGLPKTYLQQQAAKTPQQQIVEKAEAVAKVIVNSTNSTNLVHQAKDQAVMLLANQIVANLTDSKAVNPTSHYNELSSGMIKRLVDLARKACDSITKNMLLSMNLATISPIVERVAAQFVSERKELEESQENREVDSESREIKKEEPEARTKEMDEYLSMLEEKQRATIQSKIVYTEG